MEDDVFGLEVAVDDLALVHVVQRPADLLHDHAGEFLAQLALPLEEGVELPRGAQLLHQVDMCLICEEGVQLHHVGVAQEALDLDLPHQLHEQLRVHVPLTDPLQRADEAAPTVPRHEYLSELARTQLLPQHEVTDADAALLLL